jgi:hypothetical protein
VERSHEGAETFDRGSCAHCSRDHSAGTTAWRALAIGAGIAILSVPVLTLGPGRDLPSQLSAWINAHVRTDTGQEGWLPARYVSP